VERFCSIKVFPPYITRDAHEAKYLRRADSDVHLYIPPAVARALHNPSIPLTWVEGEKKALKGTQEGLSCIGLGGLWNFPMDGKPLPDLDAIAYAHR
jgi:hypothetical protein